MGKTYEKYQMRCCQCSLIVHHLAIEYQQQKWSALNKAAQSAQRSFLFAFGALKPEIERILIGKMSGSDKRSQFDRERERGQIVEEVTLQTNLGQGILSEHVQQGFIFFIGAI